MREKAEQKAIGKASRILNRSSSSKPTLGIIGCMAQNRGDSLFKELPGLDLVVGTQKFHRISELLDQTNTKNRIIELGAEHGSQNEIRHHLSKKNGPSAFVSIMQGCNMNCSSFCIVPKTRGTERYRPMGDIVDEISGLVETGVKVTLLGQIVNAYGRGEFPLNKRYHPFCSAFGKDSYD